MSAFFNYFPSLLYSNTAATNIIAKVRFDESVAKNLAVFYPYTVVEGERPDQIAQNYYDDASYDWVIYLSNNIVDPYHEWHLPQDILTQHLIQKYGSIANSQAQIAYYRVNYEVDDSVISTAAYEALSPIQKQYWDPILGFGNRVINWQRKEIDRVSETNKTVSLDGSFGTFNQNDIIKQSSSVMGTVSFANSTNIVIRNVTGNWQDGETVYNGITGGVANATISAVTTTSQPISDDEAVYWSPVYWYDLEQEQNEQRKHIRLLSNAYLDKIESDMKDVLAR